jgi:uncharacterized cupredoxin-like copper-binding protein
MPTLWVPPSLPATRCWRMWPSAVRAAALGTGLLALVTAGAWAQAPVAIAVEMSNGPNGLQVMRLDRTTVPSGEVRFTVRNVSADVIHEFLVVGTPLAPQQLPLEADGSRVNEGKLEGVTELGDIDPGGSGTLTMNLQPGHYVLFCNEPGHFTAGMRAELTVTR